MNKVLLDYLEDTNIAHKPIWLMRQAGRYLAEYREIRQKFKDFLEFCYTPEASCEVTLQPIRRFDVDAAIIFSDILVIPHALGQQVEFTEGPILTPLTVEQIKHFNFHKLAGSIQQVYEAIHLTKSKLNDNKALIGFAGGAWTLACYMLGNNKNEFKEVKLSAFQNDPILERLIEGLTETITIHLINQIAAGADIVQIFDSWAGLLTDEFYEKFIVKPTKNIVKNVKQRYPHVKIIGFPRGSNSNYYRYLQTGIDVLSIDQTINLEWALNNLSKHIVLQGNIDPIVLLTKNEFSLRNYIENYLKKIENYRFICNLGHGVIKETPVKNVAILSEMVKSYKK